MPASDTIEVILAGDLPADVGEMSSGGVLHLVRKEKLICERDVVGKLLPRVKDNRHLVHQLCWECLEGFSVEEQT